MANSPTDRLSRLERREIPSLPQAERGLKSVPAWLLSLLLHVGILTAVATLWVARPTGTGGSPDRPVGVAVVYENAAGEEYFLGDSGDANSAASQGNLVDSLPQAESGTADADAVLQDLLPGDSGPPGDPTGAAGSLGLGDGGAALGGNRGVPKAKTTVFGIEGEGTRFLYVFDRSDSMNGYGGAPLRVAKQQLLESLESLGPVHQFQIIFYNDAPLPYGGVGGRGPQLLTGDDAVKRSAQKFVRNIVAVGGTQHIEALRMAFAMGPDVIFFLTDADQPAPANRDLENLQLRAERIGATIHTIQFGAGPNQGGGWIQFLAASTRGQYRYVDVTDLAAE